MEFMTVQGSAQSPKFPLVSWCLGGAFFFSSGLSAIVVLSLLLFVVGDIDVLGVRTAAAQSDSGATPRPTEEAPPVGGDVRDYPHAVIPAGQEALLADMLGKGVALPGGCKLTDGKIEYTVVRATYGCPGGEVTFDLAHPSQATATEAQTDQFALVLKTGSPPEGLVAALMSRIRSQEAAFQWTLLGKPRRRFSLATMLIVGAGLGAIAVLVWRLRGRAAARRQS
jgi:hypothetical protein